MVRFLIILLSFNSITSNAYILFSSGAIKQCSVMNVRKPEFKICLKGASTRPDFERLKSNVALGAVTWLKIYKMLDYSVTTKVVFSCESPALTVNILSGNGRSYARTSEYWLFSATPAAVAIHEAGHALAGLSDTYAGNGGSCKSGQPPSAMCLAQYGERGDHTKFSTLYPDDVDGATRAYRIAHGGGTTPTMRDPEFSLFTPIDLVSPFFGLDIGEDTQEYAIESHQVQILQSERETPINWNAEFE